MKKHSHTDTGQADLERIRELMRTLETLPKDGDARLQVLSRLAHKYGSPRINGQYDMSEVLPEGEGYDPHPVEGWGSISQLIDAVERSKVWNSANVGATEKFGTPENLRTPMPQPATSSPASMSTEIGEWGPIIQYLLRRQGSLP